MFCVVSGSPRNLLSSSLVFYWFFLPRLCLSQVNLHDLNLIFEIIRFEGNYDFVSGRSPGGDRIRFVYSVRNEHAGVGGGGGAEDVLLPRWSAKRGPAWNRWRNELRALGKCDVVTKKCHSVVLVKSSPKYNITQLSKWKKKKIYNNTSLSSRF